MAKEKGSLLGKRRLRGDWVQILVCPEKGEGGDSVTLLVPESARLYRKHFLAL